MKRHSDSSKITLFQWIWRSYFKTSLVPLLVVEIALITTYFLSNQFANKENIKTIVQVAKDQLAHLAMRESAGINHQLESIVNATAYLQKYSTVVMSGKNLLKRDDPKRFAFSPDGAYYTTRNALGDIDGSAVFYSGFVKIGEKEKEKALRTAALDPALKSVKQTFPLIAQTYFNSFDSLNRIYPYFDVISQYPAKMDIPSYNFYYEADAKHNPSRGTVWTDAYIDPAGQGWMTTCSAPVYNGDFLEGVVGVDITIETIVSEVKALEIPWKGYGVLIDKNGTILALPSVGENDWGIKNMTASDYSEAIKKDTFRTDDYNLYLKKPEIATTLKNAQNGVEYTTLQKKSILAWATVPSTGWKLLVVVPTDTIFEPSNSLSARLNTIAWLMIGGMLVFYSIFFTMLYRQSRKMSLSLSKPLHNMDEMVSEIAAGRVISSQHEFFVKELDSTATGILEMGNQLESAKQAREIAAAELNKRTEQLQMVFDVSPSGYVLVNSQQEILLVNKAVSLITGLSMPQLLALNEQTLWAHLESQASEPLRPFENQNELYRVDLVKPRLMSLLCCVRKIYLQNGDLLGKLYFLHDITKEEEANRIKAEFLMSATHELRTPLSTIHGYAELLNGGMIPAEMQPELIATIYQQTTWLVTMINELLDLSRIEERAGSDFVIEQCELGHVLSDAMAEFNVPQGREPIIYTPISSAIVLNLDKEKFKKALLNIVNNAYTYSPNGGAVSLNVHQNVEQQFVEIEVADCGLGLSEEDMSHVFDRFFRVDKSGNVPGVGLGLSLAKEIITLFDGEIRIESELGRGSRVFIRLKLKMPLTNVS
ncbi:MAG: ATP-binding protein [Methylococcales bacterium]|nr:ATP-binding protein [Methylococcales bacterium]